MALALATNTDPEVWFRQDDRTIATALTLLDTGKDAKHGPRSDQATGEDQFGV